MPLMQRAAALPVRRRLRGDDASQACQMTGRVTDRRQIARQIWEAHKHWDGEKKFALRMIIKWLEEEKNVGTVVDTDVSGGS